MLADDELSTLEAALAFVDAHFRGSSQSVVDGWAVQGDGEELAKTTKAAAKRARDIQAAARSNRKKRAELLQLRALAATLETRRDTLRVLLHGRRHIVKAGTAAATTALEETVCDSSASEAATTAARRLNESRALNRRLRKALEQLHQVGVAVTQTLQRRLDLKAVQDLLCEARLYEVDLGTAEAPPRQRLDLAAIRPSGRCPVFRSLHSLLQTFSTEASAVLTSAARTPFFASSHTRVVHHDSLGPVIEMVASTRVPCALDDGWAVVVDVLHEARPSPSFSYAAQSRLNAELGVSERDYSMAFPGAWRGGSGGFVVDGLALFDVVESSDVKLSVWASLVSVRGDGTYVRERGCSALARVATDPEVCVLHSRYEIHSTVINGESPGPMSQRLVDSLLHKARQDRTEIEGVMTTRFGSEMSRAMMSFQ